MPWPRMATITRVASDAEIVAPAPDPDTSAPALRRNCPSRTADDHATVAPLTLSSAGIPAIPQASPSSS